MSLNINTGCRLYTADDGLEYEQWLQENFFMDYEELLVFEEQFVGCLIHPHIYYHSLACAHGYRIGAAWRPS